MFDENDPEINSCEGSKKVETAKEALPMYYLGSSDLALTLYA